MSDVAVLPEDAWNRELVDSVHPADWTNPTPPEKYALVVIGAGTAGLIAAVGAAGMGARVALIERHLMGGDCLNFGCVPSKAILAAAHAVHAARSGAEFGLSGDFTFDFGVAMERLRRLRAQIAHHDSAARFTELGADVYLGQAKFTAPDTVIVGEQPLKFHRCIIATGARAALPPIPGLEDAGALTNETVFSLTELPERLLILGAGPIGCELAQAFQRFGAQVTLLDMAERVMPREDPDAGRLLGERLASEGVALELGVGVARVETRPSEGREPEALETVIVLSDGRELVGDALLVAAGRRPNVEGLDLVAAGVAYGRRGVTVDDNLQTTNPRIYAAGDICSRFQFTHTAEQNARIALQNALFFGRKKASDMVVPWATYTDPEVAHVGMTAEEALAAGEAVRTFTVQLATNDRAILEGQTEGFARVHAAAKGGTILGATMVSAHAGESISQMTLAITQGLTLGDIAATIHPYPTQADVWRQLGNAWNRGRFTPTAARASGWFLGRLSED